MIEMNRNNIESWLMRYVDGELSAVEKMTVENYLVLNPDLAAELKALQQAKLPPEAVLYPFKSALLKRIQTQFEEAQLLDFIDGETDSFTTDAIREALSDDPALAEQVALLLSAKLPEEKIIFEDKASLYRYEKKRVVVLWKRMMAAAIFLGVGILLWQVIPEHQQKEEHPKAGMVLQQPLPKATAPVTTTAPKESDSAAKAVQPGNRMLAAMQAPMVTPKAGAIVTVNNSNETESNNALVTTNTAIIPANTGTVSVPVVTATLPANTITDVAMNAKAITAQLINNDLGKKSTVAAQPVVYKLLDTDSDDKGSVYVNSIPINKNKVNGILQKAGGILHALRSQENGVQEKLTATAKLR
ncbi:hypothetical protein [Hydrotalea sp.]|uniref:anti-sigma factor family protein n=1 Tax=Hydrotalea sp. TaxID=2881279 RepID=UPI00260FC332|nr:hypothetical protein [Hydrotalea sp.]